MVVKVWKSKRKLSPIWTLNGPQAPLGVICNILGIQQPQLTPAQQQISASQSLYRIFIFFLSCLHFLTETCPLCGQVSRSETTSGSSWLLFVKSRKTQNRKNNLFMSFNSWLVSGLHCVYFSQTHTLNIFEILQTTYSLQILSTYKHFWLFDKETTLEIY